MQKTGWQARCSRKHDCDKKGATIAPQDGLSNHKLDSMNVKGNPMNKIAAIVDRHSYEQLCGVAEKLAGASNEDIERDLDRAYPCGPAAAYEECLVRGVNVTHEDLQAWADDPDNAMVRTAHTVCWYRRDIDQFIAAMVEQDKLMPQARERYNAGVSGAKYAAAFAAVQINGRSKVYAERN